MNTKVKICNTSDRPKVWPCERKYMCEQFRGQTLCKKYAELSIVLTSPTPTDTAVLELTRKDEDKSNTGLVAHRGAVLEGSKPPSPKFRRPSKIVPNSTRLWELLNKFAEFRTPTSLDVWTKGSEILKLPSVRNCFTLAMTNKLVVKKLQQTVHSTLLCSCDRASWVKREERKPTRRNNIDDLLSIVDVDYWHCLNMFRASSCPSSGERPSVTACGVYLLVVLDVAGCGTVVLRWGCDHCEGCCTLHMQ